MTLDGLEDVISKHFGKKGSEKRKKYGVHIDATAKGRQEGIQIGHKKGREEGEKQAKIAVAKEMLADKMDINIIAKFTGLPVSEIEKLQK
ncbi:MAG: hypothetical protein O7157_00410 [Wolbachia endosymbiont of Tetragnatha montana]|nr:hypothetical protein [Wolbachia endosymbiont of Tetragnatha montana]